MEIVAEVGPCDGDLEYGLELVDAIAELGISMKGQWYTADRLARKDAARYDETDGRDLTQHELFQDQLTEDEWAEIVRACDNRGVPFFPTVFDKRAVDFAAELGLMRVKIASGDITYHQLIRYAAEKVPNLVLSTGASTVDEVEAALELCEKNAHVTVLACHLQYPTELRDAHLGRVRELQILYRRVRPENVSWVGYSDHTRPNGMIGPMLLTLGATMWERHFSIRPVTFDSVGDHLFAARPDDVKGDMERLGATMQLLTHTMSPTAGELAARTGARRSPYLVRAVKKGERITEEDVEFLRPAAGISPAAFQPGAAMVDLEAGQVLESRFFGVVGGTLTVE